MVEHADRPRSVTRWRWFPCPACGKTFPFPRFLLRHLEGTACPHTLADSAMTTRQIHQFVQQWEQGRGHVPWEFCVPTTSSEPEDTEEGGFVDRTQIQEEDFLDDDRYFRESTGRWHCPQCPKNFASAPELLQHVQNGARHERLHYQCRLCTTEDEDSPPKRFPRLSHLFDHLCHTHQKNDRLAFVLAYDISQSGPTLEQPLPQKLGVWEALLRFDGGARPNPGRGGAGFILQDVISGRVLAQESVPVPGTRVTNNQAEYMGLIRGLQRAYVLGIRRLRVEGDSQLVLEQMNGNYQVRSANLTEWHEQARQAARRFDRISYTHIDRIKNEQADRLAEKAILLSE